jgi:Tol biopolymer transport system component
LLVYSPWSGGDRMLWYDRNGKPVGAIGETGLHLRPRLSPDAGRVAVTCIEPESLAYHVSLAASTAQRETRLTFESPAVHSVWSPDGKLIAYGGARGQERIETRLAVKPADGSGREEILLDSPEPKHPLDWPAGGRYLLFEQLDGGQKQLWVLPVGPGMERTPRRLFPDGPPSSDASVSPDGRWIAYQSPSLGRGEIYVEPFLPDQPGRRGGRWQISRGSAGPPRWRRDGRELYYLTPGRDLMAVEVLAGAGFEAGPPKPLFRAAMVLPFGWFDVSPDGQRFLIPVHYDERSKEPPIAVLNWARLQP